MEHKKEIAEQAKPDIKVHEANHKDSEIISLKKQVAGLKGYNKKLNEINAILSRDKEKLNGVVRDKEECIRKLNAVVKELGNRIGILEHELSTERDKWMTYELLPWYKKIFFKK